MLTPAVVMDEMLSVLPVQSIVLHIWFCSLFSPLLPHFTSHTSPKEYTLIISLVIEPGNETSEPCASHTVPYSPTLLHTPNLPPPPPIFRFMTISTSLLAGSQNLKGTILWSISYGVRDTGYYSW